MEKGRWPESPTSAPSQSARAGTSWVHDLDMDRAPSPVGSIKATSARRFDVGLSNATGPLDILYVQTGHGGYPSYRKNLDRISNWVSPVAASVHAACLREEGVPSKRWSAGSAGMSCGNCADANVASCDATKRDQWPGGTLPAPPSTAGNRPHTLLSPRAFSPAQGNLEPRQSNRAGPICRSVRKGWWVYSTITLDLDLDGRATSHGHRNEESVTLRT